jgi:hypothetical protein
MATKYIKPEYMKYYVQLDTNTEFKYATHHTRIPSPDFPSGSGWERVVYLKEAVLDSSGGVRPIEYVYILVNNSMPGMVKIGMTRKNPHERAKEISSATGVPTPWFVVWYFKCYASRVLEARVHDHLSQYRVSEDREMFRIDSGTAQRVIEELGDMFSNALIAEEMEKNEK